MTLNPNNRAPGIPPPSHPEFGNPFQVPPGKPKPLPAGAMVKDNVAVIPTMRNGKRFLRMRPVGPI